MEFRLHFNAGWAVQQRERRVRQTLVQLQQGGKNAPELAMPDHPHRQPPSPPIHLARTGSAVYDTECIVDWRERDGKVEFLVKWVSCLGSDNTWEPLTNLTGYGSGTERLLTEFVRNGGHRLQELHREATAVGGQKARRVRRRKARQG